MARKVVLFGYEIGKAAPAKGGKTTKRGGTAKGGGAKRRSTSSARGAGKNASAPSRSRTPAKGRASSTRGGKTDRRGTPRTGRRTDDRQAGRFTWRLPWRAGATQGGGATGAAAVAQPRSPRAPTGVRVLLMVVAFAAMVAFAVVLAKLTLVPSAASVPLTHTNLHPGDSIRTYLAQPAFRDTVKQIGGNILLGVPFGLLLPVLLPRARGLLRVGVVTALVMVLVELVQGALVTGRAFDIDDVILNTGGALVGYLVLGRRMGRAIHPRRVHWWHRFTGRQPAD